ncbi:MAG: hypothetical protein IPP18_00435 [Rhodocyclaceae bacterium]|jgi:hypothetical protein|nr:hypothetical protein [Rhodocyclaceae bacterium]MBK6552555.1 hypothetical protein [Rhodocyclaceae bacterium]MBK9312093.1 hypothetical protein [Rhodocyclaceae bacterium]MBK9953662.1 hypothetical protein [Rhodocyclaceae bacterium]
MIRFDMALREWGTPAFATVLKEEIERLDPDLLPLQQGLARSSSVAPGAPTAMVIGASADGGSIRARAGIFYAGIIAGCSCADDPTPVDQIDEYCEIEITIDRASGTATIALLPTTPD